MASLGNVADRQTPALANLRAAAPNITRFFKDLAPFARASTPAVEALGKASKTGRSALVAAKPTIALLDQFSRPAPELANNLNIVLHDIDDRSRAVENNSATPAQLGIKGPAGYTGLEALLMYTFNQSMAINAFDQNGHLLRVNAFVSECGNYANAYTVVKKLKTDPKFKHCESWLGPSQPGVTTHDPSTAYPPGKGPAIDTASTIAPRAASAKGLLDYLVKP
jgi:hypothetical protein